MTAVPAGRSPGDLIRHWRTARHLSQLDLSLRAGVSSRHLSFLETGRSRPSRDMLHRLSEELDVPPRERNDLFLAAGYAPAHPETPLDAPPLAPVRAAIRQILRGHEPYPAVVLNRYWDIVEANAALSVLTEGLPRELLATPTNVLRAALHPGGLAARTENLPEWRAHLLGRLRRQVDLTGDPRLAALYDEVSAYPLPPGVGAPHPETIGIAVPFRVRWRDTALSLVSAVTTFGTAIDITVAELSVEAFYPADDRTADLLRQHASGR